VVRVSLRFEFSAAHRLHAATLSDEENRAIFGRCNNPNGHGHNYELEVTVAGEPDSRGQVVSITDLQRAVNQHVIDVFDHKHLNLDCPEFAEKTGINPTVENIARVIWTRLHGHVPGTLARIKVWETPKTVCEYEGASG
jgi:6-pyruvoyltetrahydropterin/6-carboxytetrahydropterin synthase